MPLIDSFLFTAEITVLFVSNRRWNTLKIVCSGVTILKFSPILSRPMLNKIREEVAQVSDMHAMSTTG